MLIFTILYYFLQKLFCLMPLKKKHWYFPRTNGLWSLKCELDIPWRWKFDAYSQPSFDCNMDIDPLSSSLSLGTCSIYFLYSWNVQVLAGLEKGGAFSESGSLISPKREDQGGHKNLSSSLWPSACKARNWNRMLDHRHRLDFAQNTSSRQCGRLGSVDKFA